jgi:hypothetical protein
MNEPVVEHEEAARERGRRRLDNLVVSLSNELLRAILYSRVDGGPPPYFCRWLYSPLARNDYRHMCDASYREHAVVDVKPALDSIDNKAALHQQIRREQQAALEQQQRQIDAAVASANGNAPRKTIRLMDVSEIAARSETSNTTIDAVGSHHAVTTLAYDRRSNVGTDSLSSVYGSAQRDAVQTLQDSMASHFSNQPRGVIDSMMQTLLVLVLEPVQMSLSLEMQRSFDQSIVTDNLIEIVERVRSGRERPIVVTDDDEDDELDSLDRADAFYDTRLRFREQFKTMRINLFARFPELSIELDDNSPLPLLRAIFSFWVLAEQLFEDCELLPQSERARHLKPRYTAIMEGVLGSRVDLLNAVATSVIDAARANQRGELVRQLFVAALTKAENHVARLNVVRPLRRFSAAVLALRTVRQRIQPKPSSMHVDD